MTLPDLNPSIDKTNTTIEIRAGEAAILSLPNIESKPEPTVTWRSLKNPSLYGSYKYRVTQDKKLVIFDCTPGDSDFYSATIVNTHTGDVIESGFIQLIVQPAGNLDDVIRPQMIVPPKDATVVVDSVVVLACIANARFVCKK